MVLMGLRSVPALLRARKRRRRPEGPLLDGFTRMGFAVLGDSDEELTCGGVGRFWQASGGLRHVPASEFAGFGEPGYVKAGFNFVAEPTTDGGCMLTTETRVLGTDAGARRRFTALLDRDPPRQRPDPAGLAPRHPAARRARRRLNGPGLLPQGPAQRRRLL